MKSIYLTSFAFEVSSTHGTLKFSYREAKASEELSLTVTDIVEWSLAGRALDDNPVHVELTVDDPLLIDYGPWALLYCHSPLPDPHRFFLEFCRLVTHDLDIPRPATNYLNMPDGWPGWLPLVYSRTYLLARGPREIIDRAAELVEKQAVEYMVLDDTERTSTIEGKSVLRLGRSWFVSSRDFSS